MSRYTATHSDMYSPRIASRSEKRNTGERQYGMQPPKGNPDDCCLNALGQLCCSCDHVEDRQSNLRAEEVRSESSFHPLMKEDYNDVPQNWHAAKGPLSELDLGELPQDVPQTTRDEPMFERLGLREHHVPLPVSDFEAHAIDAAAVAPSPEVDAAGDFIRMTSLGTKTYCSQNASQQLLDKAAANHVHEEFNPLGRNDDPRKIETAVHSEPFDMFDTQGLAREFPELNLPKISELPLRSNRAVPRIRALQANELGKRLKRLKALAAGTHGGYDSRIRSLTAQLEAVVPGVAAAADTSSEEEEVIAAALAEESASEAEAEQEEQEVEEEHNSIRGIVKGEVDTDSFFEAHPETKQKTSCIRNPSIVASTTLFGIAFLTCSVLLGLQNNYNPWFRDAVMVIGAIASFVTGIAYWAGCTTVGFYYLISFMLLSWMGAGVTVASWCYLSEVPQVYDIITLVVCCVASLVMTREICCRRSGGRKSSA